MNKLKQGNALKNLDKRSSWIFLLIGLVILLFSIANWYYELKPRLENESIMNIQIMSASRAKAIESQFQNVQGQFDYSIIYNSINELLLLNEPSTGQNLYFGVELEVDYDALPFDSKALNIYAGNTKCEQCIKTENPIYNRANGELLAIIKIYSNPFFYQRLINDVGNQLSIVIAGVLLILLVAWYLTESLFKRLNQREKSLTHEILERKNVEKRLHKIATYDQLTNLPNRYLLHMEFNRKIEEAQRNDHMLAVLFFDLDHFKTINDIYGHEIGDILLQQVAQRITGLVRSYDLFSRFGGDEFVMIMPNLDGAVDVFSVVEKIIESFDQEFNLGEAVVQVTTSIGISVFPQDGSDASSLLKNADLAMYRAKSEGRNGYNFFTQNMNKDLQRSQWIESNLKKAINENQLKLYFQPQLEIESGNINSCEALLRWPQEDGSFIEPTEFIPIAERSGLINDVGNWIFDAACSYQKQWTKRGLKPVRIDINLSGKDFLGNKVVYHLIEYIAKNKKLANKIGIEITENILLDSNEQVINLLTELHQSKVHISIDDFGTGYSSMNYLKHFPVSCIKIDQGFVREAPNSRQDQIIMRAITTIGHGLGMTVTAEGVETLEHYQLIEEIGCDLIQGYYISRPLTAEHFEEQYLLNTSDMKKPVTRQDSRSDTGQVSK